MWGYAALQVCLLQEKRSQQYCEYENWNHFKYSESIRIDILIFLSALWLSGFTETFVVIWWRFNKLSHLLVLDASLKLSEVV